MKVVASTRTAQGTGASRRLRRNAKVPGIVYGGSGAAVSIEIDHNPLYHALRVEAFHSSILDMEIDGTVERVLLRDVQWHPYRQLVMHVDFQRVSADHVIHVRVPLHFLNQENSPAVKQSGALVNHVMNEIDVSCLPKDLPEFIEVDLSELAVGQTLHVKDLRLPAGVTPIVHGKDDNPAVVTTSTKGGGEEAAAATPAA